MSKAASGHETPDQQIRTLFGEYAQSLTQSTFMTTDPRTGYSVRVKRQLTQQEQQRFYNSLPVELQQHIDERRKREPALIEDTEPTEWEEEEEPGAEQLDESRQRLDEQDLLAYETFLHMDIAEIPYDVLETLSPGEIKQLEASPSFRSREAVFNRKKKGKMQHQRFVNSPLLQAIARRRLSKIARQEAEYRKWLKRSVITEVIVRYTYFDPNPGTKKS